MSLGSNTVQYELIFEYEYSLNFFMEKNCPFYLKKCNYFLSLFLKIRKH